jgi:hypothetical protein
MMAFGVMYQAPGEGGSGGSAAHVEAPSYKNLQELLDALAKDAKNFADRGTHSGKRDVLKAMKGNIERFLGARENQNDAAAKKMLQSMLDAIGGDTSGLLKKSDGNYIADLRGNEYNAAVLNLVNATPAPMAGGLAGEPKNAGTVASATGLDKTYWETKAKEDGKRYADIVLDYIYWNGYNGMFSGSETARLQAHAILDRFETDLKTVTKDPQEQLGYRRLFANAVAGATSGSAFETNDLIGSRKISGGGSEAFGNLINADGTVNEGNIDNFFIEVRQTQFALEGFNTALKTFIATGKFEITQAFRDAYFKNTPWRTIADTTIQDLETLKAFVNEFVKDMRDKNFAPQAMILLDAAYGQKGELLPLAEVKKKDTGIDRYERFLTAEVVGKYDTYHRLWGEFAARNADAATTILTSASPINPQTPDPSNAFLTRQDFDILFMTAILKWQEGGSDLSSRLYGENLAQAINKLKLMPPYTQSVVFRDTSALELLYNNLRSNPALFAASVFDLAGYLTNIYNAAPAESRITAMENLISQTSLIRDRTFVSNALATYVPGRAGGIVDLNSPSRTLFRADVPPEIDLTGQFSNTLLNINHNLPQFYSNYAEMRRFHYHRPGVGFAKATRPYLDTRYLIDYEDIRRGMLNEFQRIMADYAATGMAWKSISGDLDLTNHLLVDKDTNYGAAFRASGTRNFRLSALAREHATESPQPPDYKDANTARDSREELAVRNLNTKSLRIYDFAFTRLGSLASTRQNGIELTKIEDEVLHSDLNAHAAGADVMFVGNLHTHWPTPQPKDKRVDANMDMFVNTAGSWYRLKIDKRLHPELAVDIEHLYAEVNQNYIPGTSTSSGYERDQASRASERYDRKGFFIGWQTGIGKGYSLGNLDVVTKEGNRAYLVAVEKKKPKDAAKKDETPPALWTTTLGYFEFTDKVPNQQQMTAPSQVTVADRGKIGLAEFILHDRAKVTVFGGAQTRGGQALGQLGAAEGGLSYIYRFDPQSGNYIKMGSGGAYAGRVTGQGFVRSQGTKTTDAQGKSVDNRTPEEKGVIVTIGLHDNWKVHLYGLKLNVDPNNPLLLATLEGIRTRIETLRKNLKEADIDNLRQDSQYANRQRAVAAWGGEMAFIADALRAYMPTAELGSPQLGEFAIGLEKPNYMDAKIVVSRVKGKDGEEHLMTGFFDKTLFQKGSGGLSVIAGFPIMKGKADAVQPVSSAMMRAEKNLLAAPAMPARATSKTQEQDVIGRIENFGGARVNFGKVSVVGLFVNIGKEDRRPGVLDATYEIGPDSMAGLSLTNLGRNFRDKQLELFYGNKHVRIGVDAASFEQLYNTGIAFDALIGRALAASVSFQHVWDHADVGRKAEFNRGTLRFDYRAGMFGAYIESTMSKSAAFDFNKAPYDATARVGFYANF